MRKFRYLPLFLLFVFCILIISQKFNFLIRGVPIGGHSWKQISNDLPTTICFSIIWSLILNLGFNQLLKQNGNEIKKRIKERQKYSSPPHIHQCRVCGYSNKECPWGGDGKSPTYQICPCCGVQYGVKDITPEEIQKERKLWAKSKYKWFDSNLKPADWSSEEQLKNIPKIGTGENNV